MNDEIRNYILTEFLPGESAANVRDDTPLRTSGVLDSMATLKLVAFVERQYGIEVDAHEAGIDNFDCIRDLVAFIARKQSANRK